MYIKLHCIHKAVATKTGVTLQAKILTEYRYQLSKIFIYEKVKHLIDSMLQLHVYKFD